MLNDMLKMTVKWIRESFFASHVGKSFINYFHIDPSHGPLCPSPEKLGRRKWFTARHTASKVWAVCGMIGYMQFKSALEPVRVTFKNSLRNRTLLGEMTNSDLCH